jgi:hypothetical protein
MRGRPSWRPPDEPPQPKTSWWIGLDRAAFAEHVRLHSSPEETIHGRPRAKVDGFTFPVKKKA